MEVTEKPSDKEGIPREKWRKKQWMEKEKRGRERRKKGIKLILSLRQISETKVQMPMRKVNVKKDSIKT